MSASAIVPLTVTYAPANAATTTVTVLGQVLNNGGTNWVPTGTSDNAIYLYTSGSGPSTVLGRTTYYISAGPAVPAQVTISVSSGAASGSARPTATGSSAMASGSSIGMSSSGPVTTGNGGGTSSASQTASAAASSSTGGAGRPVKTSTGGVIGLVFTFVLGLLWV